MLNAEQRYLRNGRIEQNNKEHLKSPKVVLPGEKQKHALKRNNR
jgi:hypothetical protein